VGWILWLTPDPGVILPTGSLSIRCRWHGAAFSEEAGDAAGLGAAGGASAGWAGVAAVGVTVLITGVSAGNSRVSFPATPAGEIDMT
jgi:hypothetical protein